MGIRTNFFMLFISLVENFRVDIPYGPDANIFVEDFGALGLQLDLSFFEGADLTGIDLGAMIEDHEGLAVDAVDRGVAMTIEIEGIPLTGGVFGVAGFYTVATGVVVGAETVQGSFRIID